uniref:Putative Flagellar hook-associated protein 3 (FlgL) n=1 Tax=Magnetococcus massalia (strain MO-1) TaxID=451514 RepID=A0A1S7LMR9_MAGMO|nr:Putative Flagellar hook-associated protein 3 (flgL) [Candidatus Magnetococcus massalia]
MLRVTQASMYTNTVNALQSQYNTLGSIQEQSTSGSRVNRPSEDPSATYRDLLFGTQLSEVDSLVRTTDLAAQRMQMAETNLGVMEQKMLDAQQMVLIYGNNYQEGQPSVYQAASREALALYEDIFSSANAKLDGVPLFSGANTDVPFDESVLTTTSVKKRADNSGSFVSAGSDFSAALNGTPSDIPLSARIIYRTTDDAGTALATPQYQVDVNGETLGPFDSTGFPQEIDLGNGTTFTAGSEPADKDAFYFEVVPDYQGGDADREVRIADNQRLDGNVTGAEIIEGTGNGRDENLFGSLAGLRGALLRADSEEVSAWLTPVQEGRAQVQDLQAITGVRTVLMESVNDSLELDSDTLQTSKAINVDVDAFEIYSRLQQTSQSMQMMAVSERQVLDTSLLDFIR